MPKNINTREKRGLELQDSQLHDPGDDEPESDDPGQKLRLNEDDDS